MAGDIKSYKLITTSGKKQLFFSPLVTLTHLGTMEFPRMRQGSPDDTLSL